MAPATATALKPLPPQLPDTIDDWHRQIKADRTINDLVEDIHRMLANDVNYKRLLYAVYDEQAVEGSLSADNTLAAKMMRDKAKEMDDDHPLLREKLATISKALGVVLRRYKQDRRNRRNMIGGEVVEGGNGSNGSD